jgi:hypothetical protein
MATESKQRNEKFKYAALDIKDLTMTELIELKENLEKENAPTGDLFVATEKHPFSIESMTQQIEILKSEAGT